MHNDRTITSTIQWALENATTDYGGPKGFLEQNGPKILSQLSVKCFASFVFVIEV